MTIEFTIPDPVFWFLVGATFGTVAVYILGHIFIALVLWIGDRNT